MQSEKVTGYRLQVAGCIGAAWIALVASLAGCSPKDSPRSAPAGNTNQVAEAAVDDARLLLRVRFAGTVALMADTNAAYLTNIAALPETAALGQRLVERFASLPGRLLATGSTNAALAAQLAPVFSNLLQQGFALELRGDSNGVDSMTLAAPAAAMGETPLQAALSGAASARSSIQSTNGWTLWTVGDSLAAPRSPLHAPPAPPSILAVDLASTLLPGPVRRSVYGGFERLGFSATPTDRGFKIRGGSGYAADLPSLGGPVVIPTNLVTEPVVSFTMVRNPGDWLALDSPLRDFLPVPVPDTAYFWGGESSPYQFFVALPFAGTNRFVNEFAPALVARLEQLSAATDSGAVVLDTNRMGIQWQGVPFVGPQLFLKSSGTSSFLVAEIFPAPDFGSGLTPALIQRASGGTDTVLFDWEFTAARIDTWFRVGQLAIFLSGNKQLRADTAALKWMQAVQQVLPGGGNMFTVLSQTGPRELSLDRLAPLGFSSLELFWLANWLESEKFPAANFLVPVPPPDYGTNAPSSP